MKTKLFLILFLIFFAINVQSSFAQKTETQKVLISKQKNFSASKLKVKFLSLVEDSRCPEDTNCIWEGNAKIKVEITGKNGKETFEMNTNLGARGASFQGFAVNLVSLTPAPKANAKLDKNSYLATFSVVRLIR